MYKIGIIGENEGIYAFSSLGINTFPVHSTDEAETVLKKLLNNNYAIIYITENYIKNMPDLFEKYQKIQTPAIIPIPSYNSQTGFGMDNLKKYIEQAVGTDIGFDDDN